jgi:ABC-2 type transport system permease protein
MKRFIYFLIALFALPIVGQQKITLEECYNLVEKNYPLVKQTNLIKQKSDYEIEALNKAKLPSINLNAQATYQSDVIGLPTAMPSVEPLNKDQYRATLDVNQLINAIDGAAAGVSNVYITQIISGYNQSIKTQLQSYNQGTIVQPENIITIPSFWYNKTLNYKTFMVPGILVLLVTMLSLFLSSMNIVREKEVGTLEQINVTPIKKHQFIIGKLFPFWVLGLVILTVGLIIAKVIFNVPILGNIFLVYGFTAIYLILILGIGLFISNQTETQQQAMFIAWFFTVIFILMSGLFTPIESMPTWAQKVTLFNPIRYFVEVIRMVMLKGAGFNDIKVQIGIIALYAFVINGFAVWSYKKTN